MSYEDTHKSETESESESEMDMDCVSVVDSNSSQKRLSIVDVKSLDPDYYVTTTRVNRKIKKIGMYSTFWNPGRLIRDPVFGNRSKDRVGTIAERNYFRVRMTTVGDGVNPVTLYYDCPEAYEKHMRTKVSYEVKSKWRNRNTI